jgi:hypothetical protein
MCKFFAQFYGSYLADQNACCFRYSYVCQSGDSCGTLANDFAVQCAVDEDCFPNLFGSSGVRK